MKLKLLGCLLFTAVLLSGRAWAHCQIPCGIYGDETRFTLMKEHVATIEKSMKYITEAEKAEKSDANQLVRWINNKDQHADELSNIVTYYFMAQRLKPVPAEDTAGHAEYQKKLELLHRILVRAMKAKQTTDLGHVAELNSLIDQFRLLYLGPDADHAEKHH